MLRLFRRLVPVTNEFHGNAFLVRQGGRLFATPLLMVLVCIEASDLLFAVDSIPAIFAITNDPFIVYTSNIFAILGLRSLYFALSGMMGKFRYLNVGLALVLSFVGVKMLIAQWYKIPIALSLGVVALLLGASVTASVLNPEEPPPLPHGSSDTDGPEAS
jgi:tellurite resistance protein TerC